MKRFMVIFITVPIVMAATALLGGETIRTLSVQAVRKMQIQEEKFLLIDCRAKTDYKVKHIEGAVSIPLFALGFRKLPRRIDLILYCSGIGCNISLRGARKLLGYGYRRVLVMNEGLAGWEKRGYPVVLSSKSRQVNRDKGQR